MARCQGPRSWKVEHFFGLLYLYLVGKCSEHTLSARDLADKLHSLHAFFFFMPKYLQVEKKWQVMTPN